MSGTAASTDPRQKMSALSAIINPLSLGQDKTKIFLFSVQVENDSILAFEQRALGDTKKQELRLWKKEGSSTIHPPKVNLPSSIVALYHDLCLHVYGVLDDDPKSICLLSPVYERQPATAPTGHIAGCTNGDTATLFFESTDNGKSVIAVKDFPADGDGNNVVYTNDFLSGTYLGAAYDGTDYWVAYQRPNNIISVSNFNLYSIWDVSTQAKQFLESTPIALLFVPASQWKVEGDMKARGRLVVYWLDNAEIIQRSWSIVGHTGDVKFSSPSIAGGKNNTATQFGQMSILYDPKGLKNVIHCYPKAANRNPSVQIHYDAWSGF